MGLLIRSAARRADALIAGTAAARDEICSVLGVDPGRFTVIHHGHEHTQRAAPTAPREIRERFSLGDRRVVLCVAAKRPHKNQATLIRALALIPATRCSCSPVMQSPTISSYATSRPSWGCRTGALRRLRARRGPRGLWSVAGCAAFSTLGRVSAYP